MISLLRYTCTRNTDPKSYLNIRWCACVINWNQLWILLWHSIPSQLIFEQLIAFHISFIKNYVRARAVGQIDIQIIALKVWLNYFNRNWRSVGLIGCHIIECMTTFPLNQSKWTLNVFIENLVWHLSGFSI